MNEELQSERARSDYARNQMQMRQWNNEMNRFAEYQKLCAERGEEPTYKSLGVFRRAYRSEEGSLSYAKSHYAKRDARELEGYTQVLGVKNVPSTLAKFQKIKYNKNKQKYASMQVEVGDAKIRRKLGTAELPLTIQTDKQGKHIKGHKNFTDDRSYLAVETIEEGIKLSQEIVDKYHGKGEMYRYRSGEWKHTERVLTDRFVGYALNSKGK